MINASLTVPFSSFELTFYVNVIKIVKKYVIKVLNVEDNWFNDRLLGCIV
jgi:hypothetical protein